MVVLPPLRPLICQEGICVKWRLLINSGANGTKIILAKERTRHRRWQVLGVFGEMGVEGVTACSHLPHGCAPRALPCHQT